MSGRILYMDVAKALCIILVVIGHHTPVDCPVWHSMINRFIYSFHMPLFLFASGYVYAYQLVRVVPYPVFVLNKFKRLMIPYFVCSILIITFKLISQGNLYVEHPVTYMSYLEMFYFPSAGYFLWFIWTLFIIFLIIPFFKTKKSRNILFITSLILAYLPISFPDVFCLHELKKRLVYFMFGVFVCESNIGHLISRYSRMKMILTILVFIGFETVYLSVEEELVVLKGILSFVGTLFVLYFSQFLCNHVDLSKGGKWLLRVSAASYVIYLFHTTFEGMGRAILRMLPFNDDIWYVYTVEAFFVVLVGIVCPMVIYYLARRFAVTRFLLGMK